jgi:hypothetical protein
MTFSPTSKFTMSSLSSGLGGNEMDLEHGKSEDPSVAERTAAGKSA